ncbi:MAG: hypothetical protein QXP78_02370 [Candidatus Bathyarchaeia archaeon]
MLPQKVFCSKCGATLYEGGELASPIDIIQRYRGICPKCGKTLNFDYDNIEIHPIENEEAL